MLSLSTMSGDIVALREEVEGEEMTLSAAKDSLRFVLQHPNGCGLEELMMEMPALLKKLEGDTYWEACIIDMLTKIIHELGFLPTIRAGDLTKDLFLSNEAVDKLEDNVVDIFALLQRKAPLAPHSHKRRRVPVSTSDRTWSVRLIALLGRMAIVGEATVAWTAVESRVRGWIRGSLPLLFSYEVTAGLALAALDILDSAKAQDPVVGHVVVTGLTPRYVVQLLKTSGVGYILETASSTPRLALLTHFADILFQYSTKYQDDAGFLDSARACNELICLAFANSIRFLLNELSIKAQSTETTSRKRKRPESLPDPSSRHGRSLAPAYPFLVRLQVMLMNDEPNQARDLAREMEQCSAFSEEEQVKAWGFVMDYLRHTGQLFLDGNDMGSSAYQQKRTMLLTLRKYMGNVGLNTLVDFYKLLIDEVTTDPCITPEETRYVTLASQHTVLRLMMDMGSIDDGIQRTLKEFPSLYVWGEGGDIQMWAINFLRQANGIPNSLLVDGELDMRFLFSRTPEEDLSPPVPAEQEVAEEVVEEEQMKVIDEQEVEEIIDSSEELADQEAYPDEAGEQEVEDILDSSEEEPVDQQAYSNGEAEEEDFEECFDSSEERAGEEAYSDDEVVEIVDSSDDEEQVSGTEQEVDDYECEPLERKTRDDEETADEDDVAAAFSSKVGRRRLEPVHEAIYDYDEAESYDEDRYSSSEEEEEKQAQGVMEHEEESSDEEDIYESVRHVEHIVDASEDVDVVRDEDQGVMVDDQYSSDDEEVAREVQGVAEGDQDSSDDEVVVIDDDSAEGYEPDTTGQTEEEISETINSEEEEDDDDRQARDEISAAARKAAALGSYQISFRTTFSDMDAADERTDQLEEEESSEVEDRMLKECPSSPSKTVKTEASSTLVAFAQFAQRDASVTREEDEEQISPFRPPASRPPQFQDQPVAEEHVVDKIPNFEPTRDGEDTSATVAASDVERYLSEANTEEGTTPVVDAVPRIEDVHDGEEDTAATVAPSEASQSWGETDMKDKVQEREEAQDHVAIINHVPTVEDAQLGGDTSATLAASEAGHYLSEANTEGTTSVVDAVLKIKDVHDGEEDTATVAPSEASQSLGETNMEDKVQEREEAQDHVAIINHVPTVEVAQLGGDTSATLAASEAGRYLSEANTEDITQPEESIDTERLEKSARAANGAEKDSRSAWEDSSSITLTEGKGKSDLDIQETDEALPTRASDGMLSDRAGYEADEEKTDVETSARSVARTVTDVPTGYEADIEEKTPLASTAPALTTVDIGGSIAPALPSVDIGTETPGYEADVEEKSIQRDEESQPEPSHSGVSPGIPIEKAMGAPAARKDKSASVRHENDSALETVAESISYPPTVPRAHATAECNNNHGIEAEEPTVASMSSTAAATRGGETASVAGSSVRKSLRRRKAPAKQVSDFEWSGPAAKKRGHIKTNDDNVNADAPAEEVVKVAQVIPEKAEVVPSTPTSATTEGREAPSALTRSHDVEVVTDTKTRATLRTTRAKREKRDDDKDGAFAVSEPSRRSTGGRTAPSVHTRSHDNAVETDAKASTATETRATRLSTRISRTKNDDADEEEVVADKYGASIEHDAPSIHTRSHDVAAETMSKASARKEKSAAAVTKKAQAPRRSETKLDAADDKEKGFAASEAGSLRSIQGLDSPSRHTRSHNSQGFDSPASHTRSHDSPVSTRRSTRPSRAKNEKEDTLAVPGRSLRSKQTHSSVDETASKASAKKSKTASKSSTKKSERASKTSTKKSETSSKASTKKSETASKASTKKSGGSKAITKKSGTRSSRGTAKSEAHSENRDSLDSNPEGHAISFPEHEAEHDGVSLSSMEASVASPIRSRPRRAGTQQTSLATVPENESGKTLGAATTRTRSRKTNVEEAPAKRRKTGSSAAGEASTTTSGRVTRSSRSGRQH